ncbi:MAG: hypothetical protein IJ405_01085 [Lachnospiraceae bacterium]|nr:hypothetical protein [Lachnospiraceae bacterium]
MDSNMNNNVDNTTNYNTTDYNNANNNNANYNNANYNDANYANANYTNVNYTNANYNAGNYNMGYNNVNGMNTGYAPSPVIEKPHRMRGVLGALGGALLGGVAWTLIGCLGYVSGYIAILIFILANGGYKLLSKKSDTFGVIVSVIFGLITIIPATYCSFAFSVLKALKENLSGHFTYGEVLMDLPMYMDRYDWWGDFWGNLAQGYIFTIVVAIFFIVDAVKKRK